MYWTATYAPKQIKDIIGYKKIICQIDKMAASGNIPNLIFSGDTGCGKSSLINALIHPESNVLFIRAANEKNIKGAILNYIKKKNDKKIIVIENIDTLPESIQHPIAGLMDNTNVQFILSCHHTYCVINNHNNTPAVYFSFDCGEDFDTTVRRFQHQW